MASATTTVLRKAIRSVATAKDQATDRDLLRQFVEDADESAFARVVGRHTGMVLGVCRRTLANWQDAEDACQATFLVLARKAKDVRWGPSVANWLYATARKIARNARVAAERRARREAKAAVRASVSPVDRMTGRELLAALDAELDKLPPTYREPLILCYLEGLTRDEAAARLGVAVDTLKVRIHRGRKRLHAALIQGGCALGAGLLALAATSPAGASPPRFVHAVRAGDVPPAVAALAKGVAVNGVYKTVLAGALMFAAAAIIGFGIGAPRTSSAGPPPEKGTPAKPQTKEETPKPAVKPKATTAITVAGRVLDPDGKPVAGAKFAIIDDETEERIPPVTTGADGKFTFEMSYPKTVRNPRQVVASAPGFGLDWLSEPREDAVFRLVPDEAIIGRVIDLQGKPVAGAKVAVHDVRAGPPGAFDEMLKNWKKSADEQREGAAKLKRSIWNRGGLGQAFHTTTAADGTFTLTGLGQDRVVILHITAAGIADTYAAVATRTGFDPAGAPRSQNRLFAPKLDLAVNPDQPIIGVVRDADTGNPLPGVRVAGASLLGELFFGPYIFHVWPTPITKTDKDGRFTLRGLAKAKGYILVADPDEGAEHLHRFTQVDDTVGFDPIETGISLPRGVVFTGRVTDAKTGEGVASRVFYQPLAKNEDLFDGYAPPDMPAPWHRGRDTKTDMEGRFKITVAQGAGVMNFQAYGGSYERARATQQEIDDGIVDKQFGHFRTVGQGGHFNPEYMHAYKVISPPAKDRTATLDVKYRPAESK
jgi:RNA polymerase sigma factor (sigma-70 family)